MTHNVDILQGPYNVPSLVRMYSQVVKHDDEPAFPIYNLNPVETVKIFRKPSFKAANRQNFPEKPHLPPITTLTPLSVGASVRPHDATGASRPRRCRRSAAAPSGQQQPPATTAGVSVAQRTTAADAMLRVGAPF